MINVIEHFLDTILKPIVPFTYIDYTQNDSILVILNNEYSLELINDMYSDYVVIPRFMQLEKNYKELEYVDWSVCKGIILLHYGIYRFDNNQNVLSEKMNDVVIKSENYLNENAKLILEKYIPRVELNVDKLQRLISKEKGYEVVIKVNQSPLALHYASQRNLNTFARRGVLTPEYIVKTKRNPMILENDDIQKSIDHFEEEYLEYYNEFTSNEIMLNPTPNWSVVKNYGIVSFGKDESEASLIEDINKHTMLVVLKADMLGGYKSIPLSDSFEMEYGSLND